MSQVVNFNKGVFSFIGNEYGKSVLNKVQSKKNSTLVDRILSDSFSKDYKTERTGNKLIAMLRLNPWKRGKTNLLEDFLPR